MDALLDGGVDECDSIYIRIALFFERGLSDKEKRNVCAIEVA